MTASVDPPRENPKSQIPNHRHIRNPMTLLRSTWFAFCGLFVAIIAMGWITHEALEEDRAENERRLRDVREENVRLALWRMDSALGPLLAQESTRPYFMYSSFYPAERAYTRLFAEIQKGEVLIPSPLLTSIPPHLLLHFQIDPEGRWTSPQVPTGNRKDLAQTSYMAKYEPEVASSRLDELERILRRDWLVERLPADYPSSRLAQPLWTSPPLQEASQRAQVEVLRSSKNAQYARNTVEQQFRMLSSDSNDSLQAVGNNRLDLASISVAEGVMKPLWTQGQLILARRVRVEDKEYVQGCWMDWSSLSVFLLDRIQDLLPGASLEPAPEKGEGERREDRMLAALPVQLIPGTVELDEGTPLSIRRKSLGVAWGCLILAAAAVGLLLRGVARLSERRAAFVSAVTHELRTPLTTLRMYTEMLAGGMVKDESKRQQYLEKLQSESKRLCGLVENVLSYARIERGKTPTELQRVSLEALLARSRERLLERVEQAGMGLVIEGEDLAGEVEVMADPVAVEQILFNLVDNACKYARKAEDARIHVTLSAEPHDVGFEVRDHGPGISAREAKRLFQPFTKSDREAAASAPGVGLGLTLCRRLARSMGGDLTLVKGNRTAGAAVRLSLGRSKS